MKTSELALAPQYLIPQAYIVESDFTHAYPGRVFKKPLVDLKSSSEISFSYTRFIEGEKSNIEQLVSAYRKKDVARLEGKFSLETAYGSGFETFCSGEGNGRYYIDGKHSLALFYNDPAYKRRFVVAVTSFSVGNEIWGYTIPFPIVEFPLILQLQGPHQRYLGYDQQKKAIADRVLSSLHWEWLFLSLASRWAETQGIKYLYLLPSSRNRYLNESCKERFYMRYDVSGKRFGFKKDESIDLYKLEI